MVVCETPITRKAPQTFQSTKQFVGLVIWHSLQRPFKGNTFPLNGPPTTPKLANELGRHWTASRAHSHCAVTVSPLISKWAHKALKCFLELRVQRIYHGICCGSRPASWDESLMPQYILLILKVHKAASQSRSLKTAASSWRCSCLTDHWSV